MKKNLYLQERPKNFDEFVGHKNNVAALKTSLETNQLSHAYLFYGNRGTGKTSLARIFAKAINCEATDNKPCGKCNSCTETADTNIIEIDAASNNGVEQIRKIIENSEYNSIINNKTKVFIVDEVHMLTKSAFNAFLKTLEEPKDKVIFILITTEIKRIPATIVSRTQTYNFNSIPKALISKKIKEVADQNNFSYSDDALDYLANIADGSLRDALNILQKLNLFEDGITISALKEIKNYLSEEELSRLYLLVRENNKKQLWEMLQDIDESGNKPQLILNGIINKLINDSLAGDKDAESNLAKFSEFLKSDTLAFITKEILYIILVDLYEETPLIEVEEKNEDKVEPTMVEASSDEQATELQKDVQYEDKVLEVEVEENLFDYEVTLENASRELLISYNEQIKNFINTEKTSLLSTMCGEFDGKYIAAAANNSIILFTKNETMESRLKELDLSVLLKKELKLCFDFEVDYYPMDYNNWIRVRTNWIQNLKKQTSKKKPSDIAKEMFGSIVEVQ